MYCNIYSSVMLQCIQVEAEFRFFLCVLISCFVGLFFFNVEDLSWWYVFKFIHFFTASLYLFIVAIHVILFLRLEGFCVLRLIYLTIIFVHCIFDLRTVCLGLNIKRVIKKWRNLLQIAVAKSN